MRARFPLLALLAAGCRFGPHASSFRPAQAPAGVTIELRLTSGATLSGELLTVADSGFLVVDSRPFPSSAEAVRHSAVFAGEIFRISAPGFLAYPDRVTIVRKRGDTLWLRTTDRELGIPVGAVTKVETYKKYPPGGYKEWMGGPRIVYVPSHQVHRVAANDVNTDSAYVAELRLVSRYPQGITPALLAALLEAYGQPAVEPAELRDAAKDGLR